MDFSVEEADLIFGMRGMIVPLSTFFRREGTWRRPRGNDLFRLGDAGGDVSLLFVSRSSWETLEDA